MKCPKCKKDMEPFGINYLIRDKKKWKQYSGVCRRHIPYTPVTLIKEEEVK